MIGPERGFLSGKRKEQKPELTEDPLVKLTPEQLEKRQELVNLLKKSPPHAVDLSRYIRDLLSSEEQEFYDDVINRTVSGEEVSLETKNIF
jgi:hypothetical protein